MQKVKRKGWRVSFIKGHYLYFGSSQTIRNTKIPHKTGFLKRQKFYKTQNLFCYPKKIFSSQMRMKERYDQNIFEGGI